MPTTRRHGWIPDRPDVRDWSYAAPRTVALPMHVDLASQFPEAYDQGSLGTCVLNAVAALYHQLQFQKRRPLWMPSRLFGYYNARAMEGTVKSDAGCQIRDAVKCVAKLGICGENSWPYRVGSWSAKPSKRCYQEALKHQALEYRRVSPTKEQVRGCIASGFGLAVGLAIYESFTSDDAARGGYIYTPDGSEHIVGGHCVLLVGYDDSEGRFKFRNSWGADWGDDGYGTIAYEYVLNPHLADDFWTIRSIES